ncbi:MAG: TRAP transporter substrate-binding protein DctP [Gammaproteobacteria bacterium]|nr:MAG: TRAP transporter substrate-binding protein DctP [Gammaproteobacteria bacterium]
MLKRIFFLACLFVAPVALGAPTQIKIATIAPENSGWMKQMRAGAKEIRERTDDRVVLKFYGGGVMGNDAKVLRKMRIGQLHGASFTPSALSERYPDLNLYGFPLVFDSLDEVNYVRERFDDRIVAGLEKAGLIGFGITGGGFAKIMSNVPVTGYDDLKGRKVWVPEGDNSTLAAMEALGLSPVVLPITDVLTGLQTGLIDIVGTPPVGAVALQWYTKVKYVTDFPVVYTYAVLVVEKKAFDRLSTDDQAVFSEVMSRIYREFDEYTLAENDGAVEALKSNGIEFLDLAPGEVDKWRERVLQINLENVNQGMVSAELYREMLAALQEFRAGGEPLASREASAR